MRKHLFALSAATISLLALGLFASSVIGDDGATGVSERLAGGYGDPVVQRAEASGDAAIAAGRKGKSKKPAVVHGVGQVNDLAAGENLLISLTCPKAYPVPLAAGIETSTPGIFPGILSRDSDRPRAMLIAGVNTLDSPGQFRAASTCAKGIKEAG